VTGGAPPAANAEFGERLRKERERRRITLESIAANTKIGRSLLQGLERGNVSRWPSGIFRRSFIRAYAQAIGLEPDEITREFLERFPDPAELPRSVPANAGSRTTSKTTSGDTVLRLELAESGAAASHGLMLAGLGRRCAAAACDAGVLILIGLMLFVAFNRFWMPFTIAVVVYYGASILVLGNTPGVSLFSQTSVHGRAARLFASPVLLLRAVGSAIRQASARFGEVSSR
jgi:transcriptional regulator with XRE-family HTH domain